MGVNLELGGSPRGDHGTDLCTNGGYSGLCAWAEGLPAADYPALAELAASGRVEGSDRLAKDLDSAIRDHAPTDPDTLHVANRLADLVGAGYAEEAVAVVP